MTVSDAADRRLLAAKLRSLRTPIAIAATERFLAAHPDWLVRYGDRARRFGIEDAGFHIEFLAAAIEAGHDSLFAEYVRWTAGVLAARGIAPVFLAENLEQVGSLLAVELTDSEREPTARALRAGLAACEEPGAAAETRPPDELSPHRVVFLQALLRGDRAAASELALKLGRAVPVPDIYIDIFQECLYEVGRLWAANRITVAEEHRATAIVQFVLAQMYSHIERPQVRRGRALVTGVEGELHHVGANMVADLLEIDGWDVQFLGTNMPHEGILKAIGEHRCDLVGISATMLFNVQHVRRLIAELRSAFDSGCPRIIVGGAAFRSVPELYREVGADLFAPDLRGAVEAVR